MEIHWASITGEVMDWCCLITMSLSRWPIRLIVDGLRWRYTIVTIILSFFLLWICVHITSDFFFHTSGQKIHVDLFGWEYMNVIDGKEVKIMNLEAKFVPRGWDCFFWICSLWLLSFRHFECLRYFGCLVRMFMCGCYCEYLDVYICMLCLDVQMCKMCIMWLCAKRAKYEKLHSH